MQAKSEKPKISKEVKIVDDTGFAAEDMRLSPPIP
jgi:hypothetical protein